LAGAHPDIIGGISKTARQKDSFGVIVWEKQRRAVSDE
jgi:hypothetical protein